MKCLDEGTLQAYLDSELPEARMAVAAGHLETCGACRERLAQLAAAIERVSALLDALDPAPCAVEWKLAQPGRIGAHAHRVARRRWTAAAAAILLAAALILAQARKAAPPAVAPSAPVRAAVLRQPPAPVAPSATSQRAALRKRVPRRRARSQPQLNEFVALDDTDALQVGMVVRVMLAVSDASFTGAQEVAADLVIGEDGRAHAIRFVQ